MNYTDVTSTKTTAERNQLLADIQHALEPFGVRTEITPYSNRHFLADFITSEIRADIDFDHADPEPSLIHWYSSSGSPRRGPRSLRRRGNQHLASTQSHIVSGHVQ